MTTPVDLPQYAPAPTLPAIGSAAFATDVQNFFAWQVGAATGANVVGLAQSAATNAKSAQESRIASEAAAAGTNVPMWVSGTGNYQVGGCVKSPLAIAAGTSPVYICKVAIYGGTTDPYNDPAHWSVFTVSNGVGGAVYTTSTTLTSSSPFAISISGGAGVWLKLPDATTLTTGIRHTVRNTGDNDLTLIDASGAHIGFIRPQSGTTIALSDNSTAAGEWAGDWEMYGITADLSLNLSISSSNIFSTAIKIDNNKTIFLYGQTGSGLYAVVYDTATQTATDSLLVRSSFSYCMAALIGGNVGIMTCDSSTSLQIALVSPACGLVSTATATASGTVNGFGQIVALGSGYVASYSTSTPAGIVRAISVSGTTLSIGAEVSLTSIEAPRLYISGNYLRVVRHNNSSGIYCTPYTLAGNVLTPGTTANTSAGTYYSDSVRTFQLDSGEIVVNHIYSGNLVCSVFRLNGALESVSSVNLFYWSNGNVSFNYFSHVKMPDGRVCFGGIYNGSDFTSVYMTNTSGIPSVSSSISIRASNSLVRSTNFGFTVSSTGFTFDFTKNSPVLSSVGFCKNAGNLSQTWMDRLSRFNASIAANSDNLFAFSAYGYTVYEDSVTLFGRTIVDSPQKMRITIPGAPLFRGESRESIICAVPITTNVYGFRIIRIKCVD